MALDERSRHRLRLRLAEVLGEAEARTLMDHLPAAGWGEPATRQDLAALAAVVRSQIDALGQRITGLDERLTAVDRRTVEVEHRYADVDQRLVLLEDRLVDRIDGASRDVLASIRVDLTHQARTFAFAQVGSVVAVGTLVLAAVHLA